MTLSEIKFLCEQESNNALIFTIWLFWGFPRSISTVCNRTGVLLWNAFVLVWSVGFPDFSRLFFFLVQIAELWNLYNCSMLLLLNNFYWYDFDSNIGNSNCLFLDSFLASGSLITLHLWDQWLPRQNTHLFWCAWLEYNADLLVGLSKCDKLFLPPCFSSSEILLKLLVGIIQISRALNFSLISNNVLSKSYVSLFKLRLIINFSWSRSLSKMMGANKEP